jgi:hypothetical protein
MLFTYKYGNCGENEEPSCTFLHCLEMGRVSPVLSALLLRSSERSFPQPCDTGYRIRNAQTSRISTSYKLRSDQVAVDDNGLSAIGLRFRVGQFTKNPPPSWRVRDPVDLPVESGNSLWYFRDRNVYLKLWHIHINRICKWYEQTLGNHIHL